MAVPLVLIEDNETAGQAVQATLKRSDEFVLQAWYRTGKEALSGVAGDGAGLVVLDLGLPDVHGLELIPNSVDSLLTYALSHTLFSMIRL